MEYPINGCHNLVKGRVSCRTEAEKPGISVLSKGIFMLKKDL